MLLGISQLFGALTGGSDPLQPLGGLRTATAREVDKGIQFRRVKSVAELDAVLVEARGKSVMLDFYADWCASCKEYERTTFRDEAVKARLSQTVLIQADVTNNTEDDKALLRRFGLFGPPGIIFFDKNGKDDLTPVVIGYQPSESFIKSLNLVI